MKLEFIMRDPLPRVFSVLLLLVVIDVVVVCISPNYMNVLGVVDKDDFLFRLAPDIALLVFYSSIFIHGYQARSISPTVVKIHSWVFLLMGIMLLVPWIGIFTALFTPVSILYFGSMIWLPEGFYFSLGVAVAFIGLNAWMLWHVDSNERE